ncbi:hypothetical protein [Streptomyces sp. NPDC001787]|uniref:hypothetical protein n=1 Tax=Streptomyces sp. NPDC001787 TaxID=3154523 RepID=UPI003332331F
MPHHHRAHLYFSVDQSTWRVEVLRDLDPDDPELGPEVDEDADPVATLDTGLEELTPKDAVTETATVVLASANWATHGDWQPGHGEWTVPVSAVDVARQTAWSMWVAASAGRKFIGPGITQSTGDQLDSAFRSGVSLTAVYAAGARIIDDMAADLADIYGVDTFADMLRIFRQSRPADDAVAEIVTRLAAGGPGAVAIWWEERHTVIDEDEALEDMLSSLHHVAVLMSMAVDRASAEPGFAARMFAHSDLPLSKVAG